MSARPRRHNVVRVSDHALMRFIERAGGFEIETLRTTLERSLARSVAAAVKIGVRRYTIRADGLTYVVRDNVVVTILSEAPDVQ